MGLLPLPLELRPSTVEDLQKEFAHARAKFPGSDRLMAALLEEVGELADEVLSQEANVFRVREEALQVAVVALRIAEEGCTLEQKEALVVGHEARILGAKARAFLEGGFPPKKGGRMVCTRYERRNTATLLARGVVAQHATCIESPGDLEARLMAAINTGDRLLQLLEETEPTCGLELVDGTWLVEDPASLLEEA